MMIFHHSKFTLPSAIIENKGYFIIPEIKIKNFKLCLQWTQNIVFWFYSNFVSFGHQCWALCFFFLKIHFEYLHLQKKTSETIIVLSIIIQQSLTNVTTKKILLKDHFFFSWHCSYSILPQQILLFWKSIFGILMEVIHMKLDLYIYFFQELPINILNTHKFHYPEQPIPFKLS